MLEDTFALYCVSDSHGDDCRNVKHEIDIQLPRIFNDHIKQGVNATKAFQVAYTKVQQDLEWSMKIRGHVNWSATCTMAYHDIANDQLVVAQLGHVGAALGRKKSKAETWQVKQAPLSKMSGPPQSFGPPGAFPGITLAPHIRTIDLKPEFAKGYHLTLIMASHRVWKFIDGREAFNVLTDGGFSPDKDNNLDLGAASLVQKADEKWMHGSGNKPLDEVAAIVVNIRQHKEKGQRLPQEGITGPRPPAMIADRGKFQR
eukprot:gnl/TRDRNA2_/TRDRNA2_177062_c13_seq1.p1 gnl/TRDRNA2_/TRDRNA2_177062_c13~~gnl/TRDRNA2_/TRDRNA2_177062_c13_seq1.p1  ORF type:complete len:272 (-),score=36.14 gnl/TRDRNA2_/TRDRNA2_177062_c13_seq1:163-936(-)